MVTIAQLSEIPYLDASSLTGRFLPALTFYDDGWRLWLAAGEHGEILIETKGVPAEACYFARQAEAPGDLFLPFFNLLAQRANFTQIQRAFGGIQDDIFNLSGSLAKLALLEQSRSAVPQGLSRMAASEVEYVIMVLRSLFDLFQEVMMKLWDTVQLFDGSVTKRRLKPSFADMLNYKGAPASAQAIADRFGLPLEISSGYERGCAIFDGLKKIRDNLVHKGSHLPHIYGSVGQFVIALRDNPFPDLGIWEEEERQQNDLMPLLPLIEVLLYRSFAVCDDLALAFQKVVQLPAPVTPEMLLFTRGFFTERLVEAIDSGGRRSQLAPLPILRNN